jgi:hypothetical protein
MFINCYGIRVCCIIVIMLISIFWLLVMQLRMLQSDFRIEVIGLKNDLPFSEGDHQGVYLRSIQLPNQYNI